MLTLLIPRSYSSDSVILMDGICNEPWGKVPHAHLACRTGGPFSILQSVPVHHLPHRRRALFTSAIIVFLFGPRMISSLACAAGQGPADPRRWAADPFQEGRHADDGRVDDPCWYRRHVAAVGGPFKRLCGFTRCWSRSASVPSVSIDDYLKVTKQSDKGFSGKARSASNS